MRMTPRSNFSKPPKPDLLDSTPSFIGLGCLLSILNLALALASIAGAIWVIVTMLRYLEVIP